MSMNNNISKRAMSQGDSPVICRDHILRAQLSQFQLP